MVLIWVHIVLFSLTAQICPALLTLTIIQAHWVAFDTLVARAITFDAAERGISNYVMGPILALMYGAGPLGFLVYAVVRTANYARPSTWKSKGE
jgi:hypothetical protein